MSAFVNRGRGINEKECMKFEVLLKGNFSD